MVAKHIHCLLDEPQKFRLAKEKDFEFQFVGQVHKTHIGNVDSHKLHKQPVSHVYTCTILDKHVPLLKPLEVYDYSFSRCTHPPPEVR
jgi:hypothetical protein